MRQEATKHFKLDDPAKLRLFYNGKELYSDARSCRKEGLKMRSEILGVLEKSTKPDSDSSDNDGERIAAGPRKASAVHIRRTSRNRDKKRDLAPGDDDDSKEGDRDLPKSGPPENHILVAPEKSVRRGKAPKNQTTMPSQFTQRHLHRSVYSHISVSMLQSQAPITYVWHRRLGDESRLPK